jgi:hypothetical protein
MPKFNQAGAKPAVRSPVVTEAVPSGVTHEGAPGFARSSKSELFLLAVAHLGDGSFYESAPERDRRFRALVHGVAMADPEWMAGFVPWLRDSASMRTASVVAAAEAAKALLIDEKPGGRQIIASALKRADEPGELLAYWHSRYGRVIPKPVKRGLADAVARLYDEYALLKYDTASHGYRFGDVIDLVHPSPRAGWQGELFKHAIDRRHGNGEAAEVSPLPMVAAQQHLRSESFRNPGILLDADALKRAGMTWEDALSLAGAKVSKAELWAALAPIMGYDALLRNLRNFDDAGVPDEVAAVVAARLADPQQVARSGQFPFRFLSAYQAVRSLRWGHPLEKALNASLAGIPALRGRTLVLVDRSPSMWDQQFSVHSSMSWADGAAVFGAAVALRAEHADLVEFWGASRVVPFRRADPLLKLTEQFSFQPEPGGTDIPSAVRAHLRPHHSRVVIITDEQTQPGWLPSNMACNGGSPPALIDDLVPRHVPLYMWNFGGYQAGAAPSGGGNRHTFGGLTDHAFKLVSLLESGRDGRWDDLFGRYNYSHGPTPETVESIA